jgi:glycosyltransferase involved in cell wall biosynthesis
LEPAKLKITLWLPVLNEIEGLKHILPQIDKSLFHEILAIDGGSTDGTVPYCEEQGLTVLHQEGNGLPQAEDYAWRHTTGDVVILFTPDGNSLPELLPNLCDKMHEGYDMVIVSRYKDGAKSYDDSFLTGIGNKLFTGMVNLLFKGKYTDVLVGFRGYQRSAIEKMRLYDSMQEHWLRKHCFYLNSWELGSSIRAAKLGLRIAEIPGNEPERIGGNSKLSIVKNGLGSVFQILHDLVYFKKPNQAES